MNVLSLEFCNIATLLNFRSKKFAVFVELAHNLKTLATHFYRAT